MRGAAKCDKNCELQNCLNQQNVDRMLLFRDIIESMLASVSVCSAWRLLDEPRKEPPVDER